MIKEKNEVFNIRNYLVQNNCQKGLIAMLNDTGLRVDDKGGHFPLPHPHFSYFPQYSTHLLPLGYKKLYENI